ncbi:hypothetical protein IQ268_30610 [Oculatella sp. LEGE 06141]|uniref:hypothetical protein n=1 Tax=Oculatella sp. LEGE 06141 TaxID=1828648 RepID=UPI00187FB103|nr:hypothetical protein [Oculatella sp. LEGE 06141]MBE9182891.1 hypothetical protein [Oculatella sp. LEGE 06141]
MHQEQLNYQSSDRKKAPFGQPSPQKFKYISQRDDEFLQLFPHRGSYLWAEHPAPGQRTEWNTETRHLLSDRLINQGSYLYGVRFGAYTQYLMLDVDRKSIYHPYRDPFAVGRIVDALEPLGIHKFVAVSSSYSGGIHLYFPLGMGQLSWAIAQAAAALLERAGLQIKRGQLELFPNARRSSGADYNGHRLPLQAGSYLLDSDWQPRFTSRDEFIRQYRFAQNHNSVRAETIDRILKQYQRKTYSRIRGTARKFLNDLNADIEQGWTTYGQTNTLLGRIALREYVFHHAIHGGHPLTGFDLSLRILEVAVGLPGYHDWCRHQHELHHLADYWARCVECSNYYPYGGTQDLEPSQPNQPHPNELSASDARRRIQQAVTELKATNQFPDGARARLFAIKAYGIGSDTLYKNKDLWHPENDPKPLLDKVIQDDPAEVEDPRSLEPLPEGVIRATGTNKLIPISDDAPQAQSSDENSKLAVGGSGGFSTGSDPVGVDLVRQVLNEIKSRKRKPAAPPTSSGAAPPDEQWFRQLQLGESANAGSG